jgi:hypothetical protein
VPTNLPDQNWTIPAGPDLANNPLAFNDFAADVQLTVVLRYPNVATRDAFNGGRVAGDISFTTGDTWYSRWTGTKWLPIVPLQAVKTATQTVNNSIALVNDTELTITTPATNAIASTWIIEGGFLYTSSQVADFKLAFAGVNVVSFNYAPVALATTAVATSGDVITQGTGTLGTAIPIGGSGGTAGIAVMGRIITSGAAATLTAQWAQNTLEASNTQMLAGSWLRLTAAS